MKLKLLIVEDDEEIRTQMKWALAQDYEVLMAADRETAVNVFKANRPPVVLLDMGLPPHPGTPEVGLTTLSELLSLDEAVKIVIVSGQGEKEVALKAIGAGAYDFLNKPVEIELVRLLLKRCFHVSTLEREYRAAQGSSLSPLTKKGSISLYSRIFTVGFLGALPWAIARNACSD